MSPMFRDDFFEDERFFLDSALRQAEFQRRIKFVLLVSGLGGVMVAVIALAVTYWPTTKLREPVEFLFVLSLFIVATSLGAAAFGYSVRRKLRAKLEALLIQSFMGTWTRFEMVSMEAVNRFDPDYGPELFSSTIDKLVELKILNDSDIPLIRSLLMVRNALLHGSSTPHRSTIERSQNVLKDLNERIEGYKPLPEQLSNFNSAVGEE